MIEYFVSYHVSASDPHLLPYSGHGRCVIKTNEPICSIDDIESLEKKIISSSTEYSKYRNIVLSILNWREFDKPLPITG